MTSLIALVQFTAIVTAVVLALICLISAVRIQFENRSVSRDSKSSTSLMDGSIAPAR